MTLPEYDRWDATACAEKVRSGEVSPSDLLTAATERIEERNPALNAVVDTLYERARARVDSLPDGPFKGVPFLFKDLKLMLEGTVTTNSTRLRQHAVASASSVLAQRYEAAGLQVLGKTNTPEFGIMGITEPELRGPCRNPWNTDHTPGGSSGGSASAVAARMVPAAHGGDGGGSIRIPASACGLFGLKPTRGRVTMAPFAGHAWMGFVQEHVLCHTVRDSAALLDVAGDGDPGDPYRAPAKRRPFADEVGAEPGRLRVAMTRDPLYSGQAHADTTAAVEDAASLLAELGHEVVEARPPMDVDALTRAYFLVVASGIAWFVTRTAQDAGCSPRPADFEPATWLLAQIGWKTDAGTLIDQEMTIHRAGRELAAFYQDYDLVLTPTLGRPPAEVGQLTATTAERAQLALLRGLNSKTLLEVALAKMGRDKLAWTPNTQLFNQTGCPAMSVPLWWNGAGLPIGVQLAAAFGREDLLFRVASQLETARPWHHRMPALS